ncbi:MAG: hypothetical protein FWF53_02165 [Candidatus Azobacteroides sp.]|nr:hypothetical protein [Candidatus Azobacteroides sp.]
MKKILKIFGILFILLFPMTSCLDDDYSGKPLYYFYDEPVVVNSMGEHPIIRNESALFYVPELAGNTSLKEGDLLWTSFIVNSDDGEQPDIADATLFTARNFRYKTVDSVKVIIPADAAAFQSYLADDYSAPIESSVLYNYTIDNLLFFGLMQRDRSNQLIHTYELILNPEIEVGSNSCPTLYIRSKPLNVPEANSGKAYSKDGAVFAFDVTDFVNYYRETISSTDKIRFNLKYKTDVDGNGNDVYRAFMSNPIAWNFK